MVALGITNDFLHSEVCTFRTRSGGWQRSGVSSILCRCRFQLPFRCIQKHTGKKEARRQACGAYWREKLRERPSKKKNLRNRSWPPPRWCVRYFPAAAWWPYCLALLMGPKASRRTVKTGCRSFVAFPSPSTMRRGNTRPIPKISCARYVRVYMPHMSCIFHIKVQTQIRSHSKRIWSHLSKKKIRRRSCLLIIGFYRRGTSENPFPANDINALCVRCDDTVQEYDYSKENTAWK